MPKQPAKTNPSTYKFNFKHPAAIVAFVLAVYQLFEKEPGNAILSALISFFLLAHEFSITPSNLRTIVAGYLRLFFRRGDKYVRGLVITISIGGVALIVDYFFQISWFPDFLDVFIKRLGPILVNVTIATYISTIISKVIFYQSEKSEDKTMRVYEINYYIAVVFYVVVSSLYLAGFQIENRVGSASIPGAPAKFGSDLFWSAVAAHIFWMLIAIAMIWMIGATLCIASRCAEWSGRMRFEGTKS